MSRLFFSFVLLILFSLQCGGDARKDFIEDLKKACEASAEGLSVCTWGEKNQNLRFGINDELAEAQKQLAASKALKKAQGLGFAKIELYAGKNDELTEVKSPGGEGPSVFDNRNETIQEFVLDFGKPRKGRFKSFPSYTIRSDNHDIDEKIAYVKYGDYDAFSNVLRYTRGIEDAPEIAASLVSPLRSYYKTKKKKVRPGLADMVSMLIQQPVAGSSSLVKKILKDRKVPPEALRGILTHVRKLQNKGYQKYARKYLIGSDADLAKEAALNCTEFKDKKCLKNYERMLKKFCFNKDRKNLWLTHGLHTLSES